MVAGLPKEEAGAAGAGPLSGTAFFTEVMTVKKHAALGLLVMLFYLLVAVAGYAGGTTAGGASTATVAPSVDTQSFRAMYVNPPDEQGVTEIAQAFEEARATQHDEPARQTVAPMKKTTASEQPARRQTTRTVRMATRSTTRATAHVTVRKVTSPSLTRAQLIAREQARAEAILASYIARYPILKGTVIYVRDCPNNWQGCAYYTKGIILIDPDHTAPLADIVAHEVRHILDWRTDHDIDYNDYHT